MSSNTALTKTAYERAILEMVYDPAGYESIAKSERPDFLLSRRVDEVPFGVEVTEFYESEADARVRRKPGYIPDLLAGGEHIHKDDIDVLKVVRVAIHDSHGVEKATDVPAILRALPSAEVKANDLARVIAKKDKQAINYSGKLSHANLIVLDRTDRHLATSSEYNTSDIFVAEVRAALRATSFREVFLVTRFADQRRRIVPLRLVMLAADLFLFVGAVACYGASPDVPSSEPLLAAFESVAQTNGTPVTLVNARDGRLACQLGNAAVTFELGGGLQILDLADFPELEPCLGAREIPRALASPDFIEHHRSFVEQNSFICGIAMPVVKDTRLGVDIERPSGETGFSL